MQSFDSKNPFDILSIIATEIEHKFETGRALDIRPEILSEVIGLSIQIRKELRDSRNQTLLKELEARCYAALSDYNISETKHHYFMRLREIPALIRNLERG